MDRVAEVLDRRMWRVPRRVERDDLVVRLERRRHHPVDGEDHHAKTARPSTSQPSCRERRAVAAAHVIGHPDPHHPPYVDDAEHGDDQEHEQRDRGAAAEVALEVALLEEVDAHQEVARADLRLADQQVRLREDAEVPDDREAREDQQDRPDDRQRDVAEDAPRARAVDLCRLEEVAGHLRERGVDA